jgi:glycosyltransferase involved in cell wall biosynthesis
VKLSVVVPAFNEERLLDDTLQSIRAAAPEAELIVCDNNSTDRTADVARAAGATVVFEPHNQISRARNRGAAAASGDWLVFVDADSTVSPGLFRDLEAAIAGGDALAGGSTIVPDSSSAGYRFSIRAWNRISRLTKWAAGSFIFVERRVFEEIGGFSQELYASEELDLFTRLKAAAKARGRRIVILDRHPIRTSDRKVHLYGWKALFKAAGRFLLSPRKALRSRETCHPWYDGKR